MAGPKTTTYTYNAFNQLLTATGPSGTTTFSYDANGNQTSKAEPTGGTTYTWDARDRLVTVAKEVPLSCAGDQDCDGKLDAVDNCPAIVNPDQADGEFPPEGAVATYGFEEPSGMTAHDGVDGHEATLVGDVTRVAGGARGRAVSLTTSNDYIRIPAGVIDGRTDVTFEAWVKTTDSLGAIVSGAGSASGTDNEYLLFYDNGNMTLAVKSGSQVIAVGTLHDNALHHIVWVRSGAANRLYVDGVLKGSATLATGALSVAPWALMLGQEQDCTAGCFDGTQALPGVFDEVAFYSRALTDAEVQRHAGSGLCGDGIGDACDACPNDAAVTCAPATCQDADGDGYGVQGASDCVGGLGSLDCDDTDTAVHPSAPEVLNLKDDDCDGQVDDGTGQVVAKSAYDANGARVATHAAGVSNRLLLDGIEEHSEYLVGSSGKAVRYYQDPSRIDAVLSQWANDSTEYAMVDAQGTVYGLSDKFSAAVTRYTYDAYGSRDASRQLVATKWGYTGRVHDTTGDIYFRARSLDVDTARFISVDPVGMPDGPNRYTYANANPTRFSDPFGTCVDPGGPGPRVCIDTFIPTETIGGIGVADDRGADAFGGSYRTRHLLSMIGDTNIGVEVLHIGASHLIIPGLGRPGVHVDHGVFVFRDWIHARAAAYNGFHRINFLNYLGYDIDINTGVLAGCAIPPAVIAGHTEFPAFEVWVYNDGDVPRLLYYYNPLWFGIGPDGLDSWTLRRR